MKKSALFCSLLISLACSTASLANTGLADTREISQSPQQCYRPTHANVSYQQVLDVEVEAPSGIVHYGEEALQFGELWLPQQNSAETFPLVVLIHGGCWLNSFSVDHTHALSTALKRSGYAVWALEYRRTGDTGGGWPGTFEDIQLALSKIKLLEDYAVDLSKVALVGHSAGGHLALLAGSKPGIASKLNTVIGLAPIIDVVTYALGNNSCETATPEFMGGTPDEKPKAYEAATLVNKPLHPHTLVIHGLKDQIVDSQQTNTLDQQSVITLGEAGHFDMIHPYTASFSELLKALARKL